MSIINDNELNETNDNKKPVSSQMKYYLKNKEQVSQYKKGLYTKYKEDLNYIERNKTRCKEYYKTHKPDTPPPRKERETLTEDEKRERKKIANQKYRTKQNISI